MTTQTQQTLSPSIFPARFQILSGSALKLLACILMLIDHTGVLILANWKPALRVLFTIGSTEITWYRIVRDIGRSAFPIFCFLLIEGFLHTRNRRKYGQNLLLFALISEIPWNFVFSNTCIIRRRMYFLLCSSDISGSVHWKLCGKNRSFNYPVSWDFLAFLIFSMLIMAGMVFCSS